MKAKSIYVEAHIKSAIDDVWEATQNPKKHEQWDLRFSSIDYLHKEGEQEDQKFTYKTKIAFGFQVTGEGRSRGTCKANGSWSSALSFWSNHRLSIIKKGSGYWKYKLDQNGVQFLTRYDYETNWGIFGKSIDTLFFRPMIGWATAWSFQALKKWLEVEIHPRDSLRRFLLHLFTCVLLACIWTYQGLVPKLLYPETGELELVRVSFVQGYEARLVTVMGIGQIFVGCLFLLPIKKRMLFLLTGLFSMLLGVGALVVHPHLITLPFNPFPLSLAVLGLSFIGYVNAKDLVHARHCKRKESK